MEWCAHRNGKKEIETNCRVSKWNRLGGRGGGGGSERGSKSVERDTIRSCFLALNTTHFSIYLPLLRRPLLFYLYLGFLYFISSIFSIFSVPTSFFLMKKKNENTSRLLHGGGLRWPMRAAELFFQVLLVSNSPTFFRSTFSYTSFKHCFFNTLVKLAKICSLKNGQFYQQFMSSFCAENIGNINIVYEKNIVNISQ